MAEKRFAGAAITCEGQAVGRIFRWNNEYSVEFDDVTGVENTEGTAPNKVVRVKKLPVALDQKVSVGGVMLTSDPGLDEIITSAKTGANVTLAITYQDGSSESVDGFFSSYTETGEVKQAMRFEGTFEVNDSTTTT
jgi:hypothetical protein